MALIVIARGIVNSTNRLTPDYLKEKGWELVNGYWIEPNVKDRDRVSIVFENHYYRVWHSEKMTFIALESTIEWFEIYFLIIHPDNGRYPLSGI